MDPYLHILLSRDPAAEGRRRDPIGVDEWLSATEGHPAFAVTGQLRQVNPFTQEVFSVDQPGSGEWECEGRDEAVVFHFANGGITFQQFSDLEHPQLVALAERLDATLKHERFGD